MAPLLTGWEGLPSILTRRKGSQVLSFATSDRVSGVSMVRIMAPQVPGHCRHTVSLKVSGPFGIFCQSVSPVPSGVFQIFHHAR